jgi:putative oxidoreductase
MQKKNATIFSRGRMERQGTIVTLTMLRISVGLILTVHGALKLANPEQTLAFFQEAGVFAPQLSVNLAIAGELLVGLGLTFGLLTRFAALGPTLVMIGAVCFVHAGNGLMAQNGGWEYPAVLLLVSLVFIAHGGGPYSVDAIVQRIRQPDKKKVSTVPGERERIAAESLHRSL